MATAPRTAANGCAMPGSRESTSTTCNPKRLCTSRGSTPTSARPNTSRANSGAQSAGAEHAQFAAVGAARTVGRRARGLGKAFNRLAIVAADIQQRRLGTLAQRHDVHAWRHGEQDVPQPHALAGLVRGLVRREVPLTCLLRRLGNAQFPVEQRLDRDGRGFADHAVRRRRVVRAQEAGPLRGLAQKLGAGALAQVVRRKRHIRLVQCDAIDPRDDDRGIRQWLSLQHSVRHRRRAGAAGCGRRAR